MTFESTPTTRPDFSPSDLLLDVQDLNIAYHTDDGDVLATQNASFSLQKGEVLGLVGESGCGKSTLGLGLLRLLRWPGRIAGGQAFFRGADLFKLPDHEMRALRGDRLAMIFQNPMNSLNPTENVGAQIAETITTHRRIAQNGGQEALHRAAGAGRHPRLQFDG